MNGNRLMEKSEAADYTRCPEDYIITQAKQGNIAYVLTSPKKIMFDPRDLDKWMNTWRRVEAVR